MHKPLSLIALAVGIAVLLTSALNAVDSPKPPTTKQLIEQLGSKSFAERKRASELLRARGPVVLPELRRALTSPDAEVRRSARALVATLEAIAALQPRRITLKANGNLSAVLSQIEKQTGYPLRVDDDKDDPVCAVDVKDTSFWEVMEHLTRTTGQVVTASVLQKGIRFQRREARSPFVTLSGPFRLEITHLHEDRDIDFAKPGKSREPGARDHKVTLAIAVMAEPRFILLAVDDIRVKTAQDEDGKSLVYPIKIRKPEREKFDINEALRGNFQHEALFVFQHASVTPKKLGVLRGTLPVRVVVQRKSVVVTDDLPAAKGKTAKIGNDELKITWVEVADDGSFLLSVRVPPREPGVRWLWRERFIVEDARGNRCKENSIATLVSQGEQMISLRYRKPQDPTRAPARLVIEDWVILHHAIPFEFKDVPLP